MPSSVTFCNIPNDHPCLEEYPCGICLEPVDIAWKGKAHRRIGGKQLDHPLHTPCLNLLMQSKVDVCCPSCQAPIADRSITKILASIPKEACVGLAIGIVLAVNTLIINTFINSNGLLAPALGPSMLGMTAAKLLRKETIERSVAVWFVASLIAALLVNPGIDKSKSAMQSTLISLKTSISLTSRAGIATWGLLNLISNERAKPIFHQGLHLISLMGCYKVYDSGILHGLATPMNAETLQSSEKFAHVTIGAGILLCGIQLRQVFGWGGRASKLADRIGGTIGLATAAIGAGTAALAEMAGLEVPAVRLIALTTCVAVTCGVIKRKFL